MLQIKTSHLPLVRLLSSLSLTIFFLSLFGLDPSLTWAAKKPAPKKSSVTVFVSSTQGSLQINLISKTGVKVKRIKSGTAKKILFTKGTKLEFVAKPKAGFKAGLIVNGELVKFQPNSARALAAKKSSKKPKIKELKYKLPQLFAFAALPSVVEARFVQNGQSFAQNAAIVFSGLGASTKVTNQSSAILQGSAVSDVGIKAISWENLSSGAKGTATGTTNWSSQVPFTEGDNKLLVTLHAKDSSTFSNDTVITYFPGIDFFTPLNVSQNLLFVGGFQNVNFNLGLTSPTGAVVSIIETDAAGVALPSAPTSMNDSGVLPDEIESDRVFSGLVAVDAQSAGFKYYRAKVEKAGQTYFSETVTIWIATALTEAQMQAAADLANQVKTRFNQLVASGQSEAQALATVLAEIKLLPLVGAAGSGSNLGLWWITTDGVLGGFHPFRSNQRGGGASRQQAAVAQDFADLAAQAASAPLPLTMYSPRDLDRAAPTFGSYPVLAAQASDPNRVSTHKSMIISPYINHPTTTAPNFGNTDDYFGPWNLLKNNGSICTQKAVKETVNNGSVQVTLADFKAASDFGFIHFSTHADNYYNGLLSNWQDVWGPNDFLKGYFSIVAMDSGVILPTNPDGTFDFSSIAEDLQAKRVALYSDGTVALLPGFFQHYLGSLPNSIVFLAACRSAYNSSMADVFLAKGASAVIGYTDYVNSGYAQGTTQELYKKLVLEDKTIKEGFDSAVALFGANDADADPAALTLFGNNQAKRHSGELANSGFEDGVITPWERTGDGRIITQLGNFSPVEGQYMGIVSTGLGFTTASGELSQVFCLPDNAQSLTFSWNYNSEEFLEYCGSQYQDFFSVQMCEIDQATEQELSCDTLLSRTVDSLCGSVSAVGFSFDQNGVYSTGWINSDLLINPAYLGKSVKLKVAAGDVGDSIYDTAVLVDNFAVSTPVPAP